MNYSWILFFAISGFLLEEIDSAYGKTFHLKCPKVIKASMDRPEEYFPLTPIPGAEYCFKTPQDVVEFKELSVDQSSFTCFYRTANSEQCPVFEYRPKIKTKGRSVASVLNCPEVGLDRANCQAEDIDREK